MVKEEFYTDPRDNQQYKIVKVGKQVWMAENLRFKTNAALAYEGDESKVNKFGYLYNRIDSRIVAPEGWRLPSLQDFKDLENYAQQHSKSGSNTALKSKTDWAKNKYEQSGTDELGLNILPAGYRCQQGFSHGLGHYTAFWTSSGNEFFHQGSFYELGHFDYNELGDSIVEFISIRLMKD